MVFSSCPPRHRSRRQTATRQSLRGGPREELARKSSAAPIWNMRCLVAIPFKYPDRASGAAPASRVLGFRDGVMVSDDIRDGVPYAKEVRDLARQAPRLLREQAREPPGGNLREHRAMLRR